MPFGILEPKHAEDVPGTGRSIDTNSPRMLCVQCWFDVHDSFHEWSGRPPSRVQRLTTRATQAWDGEEQRCYSGTAAVRQS